MKIAALTPKQLELRVNHVAVGSVDFKNVPDENGDVDIGYGLGKA